jgi:hypothetical protein
MPRGFPERIDSPDNHFMRITAVGFGANAVGIIERKTAHVRPSVPSRVKNRIGRVRRFAFWISLSMPSVKVEPNTHTSAHFVIRMQPITAVLPLFRDAVVQKTRKVYMRRHGRKPRS